MNMRPYTQGSAHILLQSPVHSNTSRRGNHYLASKHCQRFLATNLGGFAPGIKLNWPLKRLLWHLRPEDYCGICNAMNGCISETFRVGWILEIMTVVKWRAVHVAEVVISCRAIYGYKLDCIWHNYKEKRLCFMLEFCTVNCLLKWDTLIWEHDNVGKTVHRYKQIMRTFMACHGLAFVSNMKVTLELFFLKSALVLVFGFGLCIKASPGTCIPPPWLSGESGRTLK